MGRITKVVLLGIMFTFCIQVNTFAQERVLDESWVTYVYNRALDFTQRDERAGPHSENLPIRDDFTPVSEVNVYVVRDRLQSLNLWLEVDSLNLPDVMPLGVHPPYENLGIVGFNDPQIVDTIYRDTLDELSIILSFSDIYEKGKFLYLRVDSEYYLFSDPFDYALSVIIKFELCQGNVPVFREAIVPIGLVDGKKWFDVVKFHDKSCMGY